MIKQGCMFFLRRMSVNAEFLLSREKVITVGEEEMGINGISVQITFNQTHYP